MASDFDLVTRIGEILQNSDLDTTTAAGVRRQLEQDFGVDLSDRKAFVREQIDIFLETLEKNQEEEEEESQNEEVAEDDAVIQEDGRESASARSTNKVEKGVRKRGGFTKLCALSPQLQELVGVSQLARTEVVKKLWAYIRERNLQDPKNKRSILCDEALRALFRVDSIDMFQMNKALSKHIWPLAAEEESGNVNSRIKLKMEGKDNNDPASEGDNVEAEQSANVKLKAKMKKCEENNDSQLEEEEHDGDNEEEEEAEEEEKESGLQSQKGRYTKVDKDVKKRGGFTKLCSLSPKLQEFVGVPELARTEVVKKLWAYIRDKNLQDSKNKQNIICDESLRDLFHVDKINMFQMNKALSKHIWPLDEHDAPTNSSQKEGGSKQGRGSDEPKQDVKRQKKGNSGGLAPLQLSDALVNFFGTVEHKLSHEDVKRMWEYIKENDLQADCHTQA